MPLLMTVVVLDLGNIFPFLLDDIGVSTCSKGVMTMTLFSAFIAPRTSSAILILFTSLALVGGRFWVVATRYVSGRSVSGLCPSRVFFFLLCRFVPLGTL